MKAIKAKRISITVDNIRKSPPLHVLLTEEENVVVARCLDFTVSSHGENVKDALSFLQDAMQEYVISAIENDVIDTILDPASGRYWRVFNEMEEKQTGVKIEKTLKKTAFILAGKNYSDLGIAIQHV